MLQKAGSTWHSHFNAFLALVSYGVLILSFSFKIPDCFVYVIGVEGKAGKMDSLPVSLLLWNTSRKFGVSGTAAWVLHFVLWWVRGFSLAIRNEGLQIAEGTRRLIEHVDELAAESWILQQDCLLARCPVPSPFPFVTEAWNSVLLTEQSLNCDAHSGFEILVLSWKGINDLHWILTCYV